jgi:hypothetical protein
MAAANPQPTLPEDLERAINEEVLIDTRDMCSTMSLVASRFHIWCVRITVSLRSLYNTAYGQDKTDSISTPSSLAGRLTGCSESAAAYCRTRASFAYWSLICLSGKVMSGVGSQQKSCQSFGNSSKLPEGGIHLAVTWNIWAYLERQCGALRLEALYLMWDGALGIRPPSLYYLQQPAAVEDLTVFAPVDLRHPSMWRAGKRYLPEWRQCVNLAYVAYVASRLTAQGLEDIKSKGPCLSFSEGRIQAKAKQRISRRRKSSIQISPRCVCGTRIRH